MGKVFRNYSFCLLKSRWDCGCQSWSTSCSSARLMTSHKDSGGNFLKMFFHRLITGSLEAQFPGWVGMEA